VIEFEGVDNVSPINPPQRVRRELKDKAQIIKAVQAVRQLNLPKPH